MIPNLTEAQRERLALLVEEMAEAIHMIGKTLRHGLYSSHQDYGGIDNGCLLAKEIGHVLVAVDLLKEAGDINPVDIANASAEKRVRIRQYLYHQGGTR